MFSKQKFDLAVKDSGITHSFIAKKLGVCTRTYIRKRSGDYYFTTKDIDIISSILRLNAKERNEIFFAKNVTNKS